MNHLIMHFSFDVVSPEELFDEVYPQGDQQRVAYYQHLGGTCTGLMVSALASGSSGPGSSPGRGHCDEFLGKTLYSASLRPGV